MSATRGRGSARREFGARPVQILFAEEHDHRVSEFEGDPARRPLTREELAVFFDYCDERVRGCARCGRKGSLAALRDGALFKTLYAWGLRRGEAVGLDVIDFSRNPKCPSFGRYGIAAGAPRQGFARRAAPKRRNVLTVFDWSVEVIEQYIEEVRPLYGRDAASGVVRDRARRAHQGGRGD